MAMITYTHLSQILPINPRFLKYFIASPIALCVVATNLKLLVVPLVHGSQAYTFSVLKLAALERKRWLFF